jgi:hypothetical protein
VRRHAKAPTAGSTQRQARGLGRLLGAATLSLLGLLLFAAPALAGTATDRPLLFSFDGSDTTAGAFSGITRLGIDQETGSVYVMDSGHQVIDKFNPDGTAANFSGIGASSLSGIATPQEALSLGGDADISVDNSGGATQGRIYVNGDGGAVNAFDPAGSYLWQLESSLFGEDCGTAVDAAGHLWVGDFGHGGKAVEFANTGSPPAQIGEVDDTTGQPCRLNLDASGNVFFNQWLQKVDKYVGGVFDSTLDPGGNRDIAIDQSSASGHLFTIHNGDFSEFESSGTLVGSFGTNLITDGQGIAYDKALDRVYVSDRGSKTIEVFGPLATGTVPDLTIEPTGEIDVSKAKFSGQVNPQSVPNSYFFEWKQGTGSSWAGAKSSTPQSLPEDSVDHAVFFNASGLAGNTTYQVRLVGTNTENGLRAASSPDTFTTATAAAAPALTIATPSAVSTTTAQLSGTVNPREDFGTTWRAQLSTDPACASGFSDRPLHKLESEASTPVAVSEELTGLIPNQDYCVRITATDSFGTTTSEVKEFTTEAVAPTQASTAFVAPRTDTSARLNGRVDPEGATLAHPLTYSFEYSEDGGSTWIALPDQQYSGGAREQIVLGEELTELSPNTTYQYRFIAENEAGPASPQGEAKSFTTRTAEEMALPPNAFGEAGKRGIELVNNPDKGNQNVHTTVFQDTSPMTADGEKAIWNVYAGAPGSNTAAYGAYLAERTPEGWRSRGLTPPAEQQVGNAEEGGYALAATTPNFSSFVMIAGEALVTITGGRTLVRVDANQHQTFLKTYEEEVKDSTPDLTDDGAHALFVDRVSQSGLPAQLEDIGSGAPETVSLMPDGSPNECGLGIGTSFADPLGSTGEGVQPQWRPGYHMIATTDASRVYFQAKPNADERNPGEPCGSARWGIYERNRETEETTLVDPGVPGKSPQFIRATPNGRAAYFLTYSNLDPADTNSDPDVYRWDEEAGESTCLTCVLPDANVTFGSTVDGRVLVSDDFSHIYFESSSQLVPGEGIAGVPNIYVLSGGEVRFVADPVALNGSLDRSQAELSADGNVLLLKAQSSRTLTGDEVAAEAQELYRYDYRDSSLECISCRRDGLTEDALVFPGGGDFFHMSADGSTVAFATRETLVPLDVNHGVDIYEWRNGVVRLISDGVSSFPTQESGAAEVHAVSADGRDILFSLVDPGLTGFEQDGFANLYDARIGGGFEPPSPPVHCSEDSCQGPLVPPPAVSSAASSTFSGRGNQQQGGSKPRRPCATKRGKARKRCMRKHRGRSQKARANHNTGRVK